MKGEIRIHYLLPILLLDIIIIAYSIYLFSYVQPLIDFKAQVTQISSADYQRILENKQVVSKDNGIEHFRHISVAVKVINPWGFSLVNSVKIERDTLYQYMHDDDRVQVLSGGGFEDNNDLEYMDNMEVYLKDISEKQLREILKDFKVKVIWKNVWYRQDDKIFYLRDYLR